MRTLWDHLGSWLRPFIGAGPPAAPAKQIAQPTARRRPPTAPAPLTPLAPSLFELAPPAPSPPRRKPSASRSPIAAQITPPVAPRTATESAAESAEARYDRVARELLTSYDIRVRKWRTSMSGLAWEVYYRDGRTQRLIESPRPKGPMSAAIFLHEVGHHAIGFNRYKPRCLEEYHAWKWSLQAMQQHGLNITDAVRHRMHLSLWYAVAKAQRRGLQALPPELLPFVDRPARRARRRADSPGAKSR